MIDLDLFESNDAKWKSIEKRFPDLGKRQGMEEEKVNVEGTKVDDDDNPQAPETPMADAKHFKPGPKRSEVGSLRTIQILHSPTTMTVSMQALQITLSWTVHRPTTLTFQTRLRLP